MFERQQLAAQLPHLLLHRVQARAGLGVRVDSRPLHTRRDLAIDGGARGLLLLDLRAQRCLFCVLRRQHEGMPGERQHGDGGAEHHAALTQRQGVHARRHIEHALLDRRAHGCGSVATDCRLNSTYGAARVGAWPSAPGTAAGTGSGAASPICRLANDLPCIRGSLVRRFR